MGNYKINKKHYVESDKNVINHSLMMKTIIKKNTMTNIVVINIKMIIATRTNIQKTYTVMIITVKINIQMINAVTRRIIVVKINVQMIKTATMIKNVKNQVHSHQIVVQKL